MQYAQWLRLFSTGLRLELKFSEKQKNQARFCPFKFMGPSMLLKKLETKTFFMAAQAIYMRMGLTFELGVTTS